MHKSKNGFTLLELLVVVLIIGILAAIALPRYQLAVDKATFAKLQSTGAALRDAYNDYILVHGIGTKNFNDLSFTLPGDFQSSYTSEAFNCISNNEKFCCMSDGGSNYTGLINCGKNDLSISYLEVFIGMNGAEPSYRGGKCLATENNTRANRLCSNIGTYDKISNAWTPEGYNNRYKVYRLK